MLNNRSFLCSSVNFGLAGSRETLGDNRSEHNRTLRFSRAHTLSKLLEVDWERHDSRLDGGREWLEEEGQGTQIQTLNLSRTFFIYPNPRAYYIINLTIAWITALTPSNLLSDAISLEIIREQTLKRAHGRKLYLQGENPSLVPWARF